MDATALTLSDFESLVGESFVFAVDGVEDTATGELINAKLVRSDSVGDREPFCLDFKFPAGANLGQFTYQASSARLPEPIALFLIPYMNPGEEGWFMTAQFN